MNVEIMAEHGYSEALYSLSLSYKRREIPPEQWWTPEKCARMAKLLPILANKGPDHAKVLRQIVLWLDIEAPRFWWMEFDTYKVGVVSHSESTMHTLAKRDLTADDLEPSPNDLDPTVSIAFFNALRRTKPPIHVLKTYLPEGYLQRRVVMLNYQVLRTIREQRSKHRLPQWQFFLREIEKRVAHPELL